MARFPVRSEVGAWRGAVFFPTRKFFASRHPSRRRLTLADDQIVEKPFQVRNGAQMVPPVGYSETVNPFEKRIGKFEKGLITS
jgi:hypothetical protein